MNIYRPIYPRRRTSKAATDGFYIGEHYVHPQLAFGPGDDPRDIIHGAFGPAPVLYYGQFVGIAEKLGDKYIRMFVECVGDVALWLRMLKEDGVVLRWA